MFFSSNIRFFNLKPREKIIITRRGGGKILSSWRQKFRRKNMPCSMPDNLWKYLAKAQNFRCVIKPMFYFLSGIIFMIWSFIKWKYWWFYYFTSNFELDVKLELLAEIRACNFWLEQIHEIIVSGSDAECFQHSRVIFSFLVCWIKAPVKIIFNTGSFPSSWRQTSFCS